MIRAATLSLASLATFAGLTAPAVALTLGTATPGGSFPAFGEALVEAFRESDPGLVVKLKNTKGSAENLTLLRDGKLDLALVQGEYAYDALNAQDGGQPALTVVAPVDTSPGLFVVLAASPIRSVDDLRGKAVALGTRASGLTVIGRTVLKGSILGAAAILAASGAAATDIRGKGDKCIDIPNGNTKPGTKVHYWPCDGSPDQQWTIQGGRIQGKGGMCLDVPDGDTRDGTRLHIWKCDGSPEQRWQLVNGEIRIGGKCVDLLHVHADPDLTRRGAGGGAGRG